MKSDKKQPLKKSKPQTVAEYEQQIGELTIHLQRLQAEFENYKKRVATQQGELMDHAKEAVLAELLPALDNLDLAAAHLPDNLQDNAWAQGMQYIGQQLNDKLAELDVIKLNPLGHEFDHHQHEAVEYVQSDKPEETIIEVITPGYQIGEKVVRPARVKVSNGQSNKSKDKGETL